MKVKLLALLSDYRGKYKEGRHATAPSHVGACYKCNIAGITFGTKTVYPGKRSQALYHHALTGLPNATATVSHSAAEVHFFQ